jgi:hypothetical protein
MTTEIKKVPKWMSFEECEKRNVICQTPSRAAPKEQTPRMSREGPEHREYIYHNRAPDFTDMIRAVPHVFMRRT